MLKEKIKNGEKTVGMYLQLSDISISRIIGLAGYDFVWVDTEHSYMSNETLLSHIIALKGTNTPVVVRAPKNDLTATKHILEMGVDGIIFPMVEDAKDADSLIATTLYPPQGRRGFGPMNAIDYGFKTFEEYGKNANDKLLRFIQIELKSAIDDLDNIIKNPYIDGYIFGPNDLAGSYGMFGGMFSDEITSIIREAIKKLHSAGKYVGIASGSYKSDILKHWNSFSPDMLCGGADFDFIRDGAVNNLKNLKRIVNG